MAILIVESVVRAVQQTMSDAPGQSRKIEAKRRILEALALHGIYLSSEQLDDLIEAAVKTMKIQEGRT